MTIMKISEIVNEGWNPVYKNLVGTMYVGEEFETNGQLITRLSDELVEIKDIPKPMNDIDLLRIKLEVLIESLIEDVQKDESILDRNDIRYQYEFGSYTQKKFDLKRIKRIYTETFGAKYE